VVSFDVGATKGAGSVDCDHGSGRKVTIYFSNIPEFIPLFRLRQYFEVCCILSDAYIARQLNSRGQVYGFVRFLNVKNREKLAHTLNNVWIGDFRVWAREAWFDRFEHYNAVKSPYSGGRHGGVGVEVKPVVVTHGVGVKNVRVIQEKVEVRAGEEEKNKMNGTVVVD